MHHVRTSDNAVKKNPKRTSDLFFLHLDLCVDAGWERKILEGINRLRSGVRNVDEALVDFHLESLATSLVDVRGLYDGESATLGR